MISLTRANGWCSAYNKQTLKSLFVKTLFILYFMIFDIMFLAEEIYKLYPTVTVRDASDILLATTPSLGRGAARQRVLGRRISQALIAVSGSMPESSALPPFSDLDLNLDLRFTLRPPFFRLNRPYVNGKTSALPFSSKEF